MKPSPPWATAAAGVTCICAGLLLGARGTVFRDRTPALTVDAVAHQWWWEFQYPTLGITTSDELHVPSDRTVRLRLTSADVIHTFWMPGMQDAVPVVPQTPHVVDLELPPGESYGTCDAACGCGAACMRFRIFASAPQEFTRWVAGQRLQPQDAVQRRHLDTAPACAQSPASH